MGFLKDVLPAVATGTIFGSALTLAGVSAPSVIINQLRMTDFHMLVVFMVASAFSAAIVVASNASGIAKLGHRKDSSYGWLMYDGNIIGGALQGIGMALTGCCPGTVFVQAAVGVQTAFWAMLGGILGAIFFVGWRNNVQSVDAGPSAKHTVMQKTNLSISTTLLGYEMLMALIIMAAKTLTYQSQHWLNPILGGGLIGLAQASSIVLSRKTVGVSSAFEDAGKWLWSLAGSGKRPGLANVMFAGGLMLGAVISTSYVPHIREALASPVEVTRTTALAGGFAMVFGARMAGGCTSGHGISGMATMALSSFITVGAMFLAGIITLMVL